MIRDAPLPRPQGHLLQRAPAPDHGAGTGVGAVVAGALVTEVVFAYPGLGSMTLTAIQNRDYFLLQGIFIFIIAGVLIANVLVDIAYVPIDPRTRLGMQGSGS